MKKFLKRNWWIILGFVIAFVVMLLAVFSPICLIIGLIVMGVLLIIVSVRLKKLYNTLKQQAENNDTVFDATKYDYDEDVYIIGTDKPSFKTQIKQNFFSKISALGPSILTAMFGVGLILLAVSLCIKLVI